MAKCNQLLKLQDLVSQNPEYFASLKAGTADLRQCTPAHQEIISHLSSMADGVEEEKQALPTIQ